MANLSTRPPKVSVCAVCLLFTLLEPSTHVPPAWWQGGWPQQSTRSDVPVELFSKLAAVLMPEAFAGEVFRSFPLPGARGATNETRFYPVLSAYGALMDPSAALFILHDRHAKSKDPNREFQIASLLAYGPPGSHVLLISHNECSSLKDKSFCVKVDTWSQGDKMMLSKVLNNLLAQILLQCGHILSPDVLACMQSERQTKSPMVPMIMSKEGDEFTKLSAILTNVMTFDKISSHLAAEGFGRVRIDRILKSVRLSGLSTEMMLQSRIHQLLDMGQTKSEIVEVIAATSISPNLDRWLGQNLHGTTQWLLEQGLAEDEVVRAIIMCPLTLSCRIQQNLQAVAMWLLDLGLSHSGVAKTIYTFPSTLARGIQEDLKPIVQWLGGLGLDQAHIARVIAKCPQILGRSLQEDLIPIVQWLNGLGLSRHQVAKIATRCPALLCCSLDKDLRPKLHMMRGFGFSDAQAGQTIIRFPGGFLGPSVESKLQPLCQWLGGLGLTQGETAQIIAIVPQTLRCSIDKNLEPVVQWLRDLGLNEAQVAKTLVRFPPTLCYSIDKNLKRTTSWLVDLGLSQGRVAKIISGFPSILGCSIEKKLQPAVALLQSLRLNEVQITKAIARCPEILYLSIAKNLKPTSRWLLSLGLTQVELAKVIATFPKALSCSVEKNLKLKVQWLLGLGLSKLEVAKVIASFPAIFSYSINQNLKQKVAILQKVFGVCGAAQAIARRPIILGYSHQRLTTRLRVLSEQNETMKLIAAVEMTEDRFRSRFFMRSTNGSGQKKL